MSFTSNLGGIRAWGRSVILPVERIKQTIKEELLDKYPIKCVIDFGAGTLYWSNWFYEAISAEHGKVYPVDIIFKEKTPDIKMECFALIDDVPQGGGGKQKQHVFYM